MVISLWQRCSPECTAPNSLGGVAAKGEIQGAIATHTMLGTLKKQDRTRLAVSRADTTTEQGPCQDRDGLLLSQTPHKMKEKSPGCRERDPEKVLTDLRGLVGAVWAVSFSITAPALRDAGDLVSAGKLLRAARFRG